MKKLSSLEAPKSANGISANQKSATEVTASGVVTKAAEAIDPSTGEIIVLAERKSGAEADAVTARAQEQVTVLAKPEKRMSAKDKAQAKFAKRKSAESSEDSPAKDGTTPDMTATAKSKAGAKSEEVLAANEARKERKAAAKAKAAPKAKGKAGTKAKAK